VTRDDWWTIAEACEHTDRKPRTIRRWLTSGEIRTEKPKRTLYLYGPDVMAVEARMTAQIEHPVRPSTRGSESS